MRKSRPANVQVLLPPAAVRAVRAFYIPSSQPGFQPSSYSPGIANLISLFVFWMNPLACAFRGVYCCPDICGLRRRLGLVNRLVVCPALWEQCSHLQIYSSVNAYISNATLEKYQKPLKNEGKHMPYSLESCWKSLLDRSEEKVCQECIQRKLF